MWRTQDPGGQYFESDSIYYSYDRTVNKQDTVKRTKPPAVLLNGTSLVHSTVENSRSYGLQADTVSDAWMQAPVNTWISAGPPPQGELSIADAEIAGRLRAKIKSQNLNLAQAMAEYRQTSSMFASLARDVLKTFRSLRSGRAFADFVRILQQPRSRTERQIANRWLQYQYGLKPLMSDLYGATDLLATGIRAGLTCRVSSSTSRGRHTRDTTIAPQLPYYRGWTEHITLRGYAEYKISQPSLKALAQMGISNPLLLTWEVIPYSFVVDWAFPVGQFLSSLDALNGTSNLAVQYVRKYQYVCEASAYGGRHIQTLKRYNRGPVNNGLPLPVFGYKPSTSLTAVTNGLALLSQIRTGR
jgi:hypothetical protein